MRLMIFDARLRTADAGLFWRGPQKSPFLAPQKSQKSPLTRTGTSRKKSALLGFGGGRRGEAAAERVFRDVDGNQELQQVVGAACLRPDAREFVAAEWLAFDQGTRDAAVEVEVADLHFLPGP